MIIVPEATSKPGIFEWNGTYWLGLQRTMSLTVFSGFSTATHVLIVSPDNRYASAMVTNMSYCYQFTGTTNNASNYYGFNGLGILNDNADNTSADTAVTFAPVTKNFNTNTVITLSNSTQTLAITNKLGSPSPLHRVVISATFRLVR
jgi:hypothetical protein